MNPNDDIPSRDELPDDRTWDLTTLYASDDEWEAALNRASEQIAALDATTTLLNDGTALYSFLRRFETVLTEVESVVAYARLERDTALDDDEAKRLANRARSLAGDANALNAALDRVLASADPDRVDRLVDATPELETYERYLRSVCQRSTGTETERTIDALETALSAPRHIYQTTIRSQIEMPTVTVDGESLPMSSDNFMQFQRHPEREVRRRSYEALYEELSAVKAIVGTTKLYHFEGTAGQARARGFESVRAAALHDDGLPVAVHERLLSSIRESVEPLHRHLRLQRRRLGVEELRPWDVHASTHADEPSLPYESAREHVLEAVSPLGERVENAVVSLFDSRRVDVHEHLHKQTGAYTRSTYDDGPFVLLNYQGDLQSAFRMAHEVGHAVQAKLTAEEQPFVYADLPDPVSEVPSTVVEIALARQLLDGADSPALRQCAREQYAIVLRNKLFRHAMFALFDHRCQTQVADRGPASPRLLDDEYEKLLETFYRPVVADRHAKAGWLRRQSFSSAYETYKYPLGACLAIGLADEVVAGNPEPVRDLFRRGASADPETILTDTGLDPTDPEAIERVVSTAVSRYAGLVDDLSATTPST